MAITYTEQFETRKAVTEMAMGDGNYAIEYIATGPIDGTPTEVNATMYVIGEIKKRVGYGSFANGVTNVRFDSSYVTTVSNQATIASQFYNDLQSILG